MKKITKKITKELITIALILILSFLLFSKIDLLEWIVECSDNYEAYEIDEFISTLFVLSACLTVFSIRRWKDATRAAEVIKIKNIQLNAAKAAVKKLEGIIPICMYCKEIRDDNGAWQQLERYICEHSEAEFSHGICEKCMQALDKE